MIKDTDQYVNITEFSDNFYHIENDQEVLLGFRPEGVILEKYNAEGPKLTSVVELTEMLGDTANIYIKMGPHNVIIKVDPHDIPKIDSICNFSIPCNNIYLFSKETGKALNK